MIQEGKDVRAATGFDYLKAGGKLDDPFELFEPLLFVLYRLIERSGVSVATEVGIQVFPDEVDVPLLDCGMEFFQDLFLSGVGHAGEVANGGPLKILEEVMPSDPVIYILRARAVDCACIRRCGMD